MIREPAVAGTFYSANPDKLRMDIDGFLQPTAEARTRAIGIVSPHAGYMYSGHVAGAVFSRIEIPQEVFVLCPNHTGMGEPIAINSKGAWRTPLGDVPIDEALARRFAAAAPETEEDSFAHEREHALEVQLPFLQILRQDLRFVPLCLSHISYAECERLGEALATTIAESPEPILMVASSDMNHYESQERTLLKDQRAIDCILEMDAKKLYERVHEESISMCGIIPTTCMLLAARRLGAKQAELIKHATSGDISGDFSGVVGYAGMVVR